MMRPLLLILLAVAHSFLPAQTPTPQVNFKWVNDAAIAHRALIKNAKGKLQTTRVNHHSLDKNPKTVNGEWWYKDGKYRLNLNGDVLFSKEFIESNNIDSVDLNERQDWQSQYDGTMLLDYNLTKATANLSTHTLRGRFAFDGIESFALGKHPFHELAKQETAGTLPILNVSRDVSGMVQIQFQSLAGVGQVRFTGHLKFDPAQQNSLRYLEFLTPSKDYGDIYHVEMAPIGPEKIWFPVTSTDSLYKGLENNKPKLDTQTTTTFSEVVLNEPIDDEVFTITLPQNTAVTQNKEVMFLAANAIIDDLLVGTVRSTTSMPVPPEVTRGLWSNWMTYAAAILIACLTIFGMRLIRSR